MDTERRLALLLADGTGDFDFVRSVVIEETLYLEGHVTRLELKQRAEEIARYVGFAEVRNALRIFPEAATDSRGGSRPSGRGAPASLD